MFLLSLPMRGAWIEITVSRIIRVRALMSLPMRGAWIEILLLCLGRKKVPSLPMRGAWIEMLNVRADLTYQQGVAPHAGSVD